MTEFRMPSLGADMERGTVLERRVGPGDTVHRGDIVAVVDTEKSDIEVEIFEDGVIDELVVPVGTEVEVGAVLATLTPVGAPLRVPVPAASVPAVSVPAAPSVPVPAMASPGAPGARPRISPLARRRAREAGVDLATVTGSGPGGAVVAADLTRTVAAAPPQPPAPTRDDTARAAVGALMARSKREIPHYYLGSHVDVSAALAWLEARNRAAPVADRILPAALVLRATALAAREVPEVNGWWRDGRFEPASRVDLGVAIDRRGGGLIAPAIVGADALPLPALMHVLGDLIARAKAGRLRASELCDPSITVTSLGDGGADLVLPVIYPPQVAMLGVGRIAERPWAEGGMVGARQTVQLTFAGDHRVSNGHEGSRFLRALERLLHQPEVL